MTFSLPLPLPSSLLKLPNYCGPSTLEKFKIKQTGREKLKLEAAGDGVNKTAALVALKAYRYKSTRVFAVVVT